MKKIALLTTGGTIASRVNPKNGKLMAGEQTGEELFSKCDIDEARDGVNVYVKSIFQIPSNQMTFENLTILYNQMVQLKNEGFEAFVITHGTDTLEESAYFLSLIWQYSAPVVFTGSQFSPTENNTDAFHNIRSAFSVAASELSRNMGVLVTFNDKIFSAQYVTKTHASNIDGFNSQRNGCIGIVDMYKVHYFYRPLHRETYSSKNVFPKVAIIKECIENDPSIVDYYTSNGTSGIVVEGYGRGHVNLPTRDKLVAAMERGIEVVITTVCANGQVEPVYGYKGGLDDLLKNGAISGHDYSAKKARIKLMLLISNGFIHQEIKDKFDDY